MNKNKLLGGNFRARNTFTVYCTSKAAAQGSNFGIVKNGLI